MTNIVLWIAIAFAIVVAAAPITSGGTRVNEKHLAKLVQKHGLPLPQPLRQPVLSRIRSRERTALTWGLVAVGIGALVSVLLAALTGSDELSPLLVMVPAALGTSLGSYRGILNAPDTLHPEAPRVARAHSTELGDYSTAGERGAVRLVPLSIGLALLTSLIVWFFVPVKPAGGLITPVVMIVAASAVVGVCWILGRGHTAIIERAQHAHNDLELAWDDALRTAAVRDLQDSVIASGALATLGLLVMAGSWLITPEVRAGAETLTLILGVLAFVAGLICWALLLVPWAIGRADKNPSLRLWSGVQFREA